VHNNKPSPMLREKRSHTWHICQGFQRWDGKQ